MMRKLEPCWYCGNTDIYWHNIHVTPNRLMSDPDDGWHDALIAELTCPKCHVVSVCSFLIYDKDNRTPFELKLEAIKHWREKYESRQNND